MEKHFNKGRKHTEVARRNMSNSHKGIPSPKKGIKLSKELVEKNRLSQTGKKMSPEARKKMSETHIKIGNKPPVKKGKEHYNWKGGVTPENVKIRNSIEMTLWRNSVFARDGYMCQKTGEKGGRLVAHHILNFSKYPELRLAIDNGITLSQDSHKNFHKTYGSRNNTKEQLKEFLKKQIYG